MLRALIARFWKEPYRHPLVHWGTALHDRFLLPHYAWADFGTVIQDLNQAGYPLQLEWYAPFLEFRFPVYGRVAYGDVKLELHMALEPWHVLGEEATAQREARVVDSAVERLQISCQGFDPERYVLTCNGRRVPLQATAEAGMFVAGIRYKAWKSGFGLHPTIEVHAPLVFDLHDRRLGRSIGGCVYHVSHPGGVGYDTFPVNAYEAESRRISRFWSWGHSSGEVQPPNWVRQLQKHFRPTTPDPLRDPAVEKINADYPCTLDLRRLPR